MGLKVGEVKLESYNLTWKEEFLKEKILLEESFGDIALSIEHIGSTSVEGLTSKPIIDIAVGVRKLEDFQEVKHKFLEMPYSVKEDSDSDEILIRKGSEENRTHFIHVMEIDGNRYKNSILFRDILRNHEDVLKDYEALKIELAKKYPDNRKMYTASKNDFIQSIIKNFLIDC